MTTSKLLACFTGLAAAALLSCGTKPAPSPPAATGPDSPVVTARSDSASPMPPETATHAPEPAPPPDTTTRTETALELPPDVSRTFPGARSVKDLTVPFPCRIVTGKSDRILGYVVDSDSAGTTATGYCGPVPVRVYLDSLARPRRVFILDNRETPAYLEIVVSGGLLDRLLLYDPAKPDSIDAVTLATSSSKAIVRAVTTTCSRVASELAGR